MTHALRHCGVVLTVFLLIGSGGCMSGRSGAATGASREVRRAVEGGQQSHAAGRMDEATTRFQDALRVARAVDDRPGIGLALYHLGLLALEAGDYAGALPRLQESLVACQVGDVKLSAVLGARAEAGLALVDPAVAEWIDAAILAAVSEKSPVWEAQARMLKARLALDTQSPAVAASELDRAGAALKSIAQPQLLARRDVLAGDLAMVQSSPKAAAVLFMRAAGRYRDAGHAPGVALALRRAGVAWREAGDPQQSADALLRAAVSLEAQGRLIEARQSLQELLDLGALEAASPLRSSATRLLETLPPLK